MDFKSQVELYDTLEQNRDPALLACNRVLAELPSICIECGISDRCPARKPKVPDHQCPAVKALLSTMNARSKLVKRALDGAEPWVGVDLDGTLAVAPEGSFDPTVIGEPVPAMVEFIKELISTGTKVKVFTARLNGSSGDPVGVARAIRKWTKKHLGVPLEATAEKDYLCVGYFDDSAHQVIRDKGTLLEALYANLGAELEQYRPIITHLQITGQLQKILDMQARGKNSAENEQKTS